MNHGPEERLDRPRTVSQLLLLAARLYRGRAPEFYAAGAATLGSAWVVNLALKVWTLGGVPLGALGDPEAPDMLRQAAGVFGAGVSNGMVYALFNGIAAGTLTLAAVEGLRGRRLLVFDALALAAPRLPALLGATLLFYLALASLVVMAGVASGLLGAAASVAGAIGGELVSRVVGVLAGAAALLVNVVLVLCLALRWALYPQTAVLEHKGPLEALQRSAALTRDPPRTPFARRYLVRAGAVTLALVALQLGIGALGALPELAARALLTGMTDPERISALNPAGLPLTLLIPLELLAVLASALVLPFGVLCFLLLYGDAPGNGSRLPVAA